MASQSVEFLLNVRGNAQKELRQLGRAADYSFDRLDKVGDSAQHAGGRLASLGGVIGGIPIPGFEGLGRAVTAAGDSIEALANPIAATITVVGGLAVATATATAGIVKLVAASDDWLDSLKELGAAEGLISQRDVMNIDEANRTMSALAVEAKRLGVILAAEFAPAVNAGAEALLFLLRSGEDLARQVGDSTSEFRMFLNLVGDPVTRAVLTLNDTINVLDDTFGDATRSARGFRDELRQVKEASIEIDKYAIRFQEAFGDPFGGLQQGVAAARRRGKEEIKAGESAQKRDAARSDFIGGIAGFKTIMNEFGPSAEMSASMAETAKATQGIEQFSGAAAKALGGLGGGGVAGALATVIGPIVGMGKAIAAAPEAIKGIRKNLVSFPLEVGNGFKNALAVQIPKLIEAIPRIVENFIFKLPFAIAKGIIIGIPRIIKAIGETIANAIKNALAFLRGGEDRNVLTGKQGKFFGTSFKRGDMSLFGIDISKGQFATGGFVPSTGLYKLHAGERVVPTSGVTTSGADRAMRQFSQPSGGMAIGDATINVYTNDVRDFARQLRRELGNLGSGASLSPR